jgi:hypothetical protein
MNFCSKNNSTILAFFKKKNKEEGRNKERKKAFDVKKLNYRSSKNKEAKSC